MLSRTKFLSRLLGLYFLLAALSMMAHRQTTVETVAALLRNAPTLFALGIFTLLAGLAMVIGHNVWSGGALAVVVTVVGWITLAKGLLLLFLTPEAAAALFLGTFHYQRFFWLYSGFSLVLGAYLTFASFRKDA